MRTAHWIRNGRARVGFAGQKNRCEFIEVLNIGPQARRVNEAIKGDF
jgi:hypothetical protein